MSTEQPGWDEPCFVISIAARMVGLNIQSLRYYERTGLLSPSRSSGNIRLYSPFDIGRLRRIKTLIGDMGVNLAGVELVLKLMERIVQMEHEMTRLTDEVKRLRSASSGARGATRG